MTPLLRIGARGSALSLRQTAQVRARIALALGVSEDALPITSITTSGDKQQEGRLIETGGKGLFTKELDEALRDGRIDIAVHSLKDLPTRLPDDITLACVPEREDPRDAFVSNTAASLAELPAGAVVGTASLRRQAQTLYARPDLKIAVLRGNVDTRIKKLEAGVADATYLALAGLKRLGLEQHAKSLVDPDDMPPAACQGALAITTRAADTQTIARLAPLESALARVEIEAERAFLEALDGSCRTPISALARCDGARIAFIGETLTPDGKKRWRREATATMGANPIAAARALGDTLGRDIRKEAGDALMLDRAQK
ncbi:MAG TPA: hydroxymethylbilane synthase [Caulobacterales bacterium]|nr:hydroxymethylbilane synthase [Caulobacterales bacterium]